MLDDNSSETTFLLIFMQRNIKQFAPVALCVLMSVLPVFSQGTQIDSLRAVLSSAIPDTTRIRTMLELSKAYERNEQPDKQLSTLLLAVRHVETLPKSKLHCELLLENASVLQIRGLYAESVAAAFKALSVAEALGDSIDMAWANMRIGSNYADLRQINISLRHHRATQEIGRKLNNPKLIAQAHASMAWALELDGDLQNAYTNLDTSLVLRRTLNNNALVGRSLLGLARVLSKQGEFTKARPLAEESLVRLTGVREYSNRTEITGLLGWIYFRCGDTAKGLQLADSALKLSEQYGIQFHQPFIFKILADIHALRGDFRQSNMFFERYAVKKDSIFSGRMLQAIAALETSRETAKSELEIASQRMKVNLIALGFGVSMIVGFVIWLLYKRQRDANSHINYQKEILERQAVEIQLTNTALHEQNEQLTTLNSEKNELMGIVAHDLKNPIGAVRGLAELVHLGFVEQEQVPEITGQIVVTSDRMLELVKNLLNVNRLESGGMQFTMIAFDIVPMLASTIEQFRPSAAAKRITLHFANEAKESLMYADEQAMMQVLDNIISNAVKYSPFDKNVFIRLKSSNGALRIEVQDEGPGISEEDMKRLFGKFARLSAQPTGGEHSTGLGLSIVKKMVEAMNGRVWCESEVGDGLPAGATFIVELPKAS